MPLQVSASTVAMKSPASASPPFSLDSMEPAYWESLFQRHRPDLKEKSWVHSSPPVCPLRALGDYVLGEFQQLTSFLDAVAEREILEHRKAVKPIMKEFDRGEWAVYLTERDQALRQILAQFKLMAERCRSLWTAVQNPPPMIKPPVTRFIPINSVDQASPGNAARYAAEITPDDSIDIMMTGQDEDGIDRPERLEDCQWTSRYDDSSGSSEDTKKNRIGDQGTRYGKGRGKSDSNICEHRHKCKFGGWDSNRNEPVVFLLNSKFNEHMARHEKPWVCQKCPNTAFARKGQLERHLETKAHKTRGQHGLKFVESYKDYRHTTPDKAVECSQFRGSPD